MYIRFVIDPLVPCDIYKIIRKVVRDLRMIFKDVTYSAEVDETLLPLHRKYKVQVSKVLQRKSTILCSGVTVYITETSLVWGEQEVLGLSRGNKCAVGLKPISKKHYKSWAPKVWDLILHELGHSFGLIQRHRTRAVTGSSGTRHCLNNCSMSEDLEDFIWAKKASLRFSKNTPYCSECLQYLLARDI